MDPDNNQTELGDFLEAAGLLSYDPAAITRIYTGHPQRLFRRLWQTLVPIGLYLLGVGFDWLTGRLKAAEVARSRAKEAADLVASLGPAFIKAGQALSTRPDIVPPLLLEELAQLQDQLPGFDSALAMACIEEDLGAAVLDIYEQLDAEPISAASLGQVHKGVLKGGQAVAVKVQRPGLREQITLDLYIVRNIASWLNQNVGLIRSDLVALIDELGKRVFEEMDYFNEAANAERFAELHAHNPRITVPRIYHQATSRRVLTMEWMEGVKLTNLEAVRGIGVDPDDMVNVGVNCSLQQLLEHGFFHADPHPGNLLAMADGRLAYIDFGMMDQLDQATKEGLVDAVVHLINQDFTELGKDFVKLGFLTPDTDLGPIIPALKRVLGGALGASVGDFNFKTITDQFSELMYEYPFRVPAKFALIIRSLVTQEGLALSLNPEFKIVNVAYPYVTRRLLLGETPALRQRLLEVLFQDGQLQWQRLENMLAIAQGGGDFDLLPTAGLGIRYLMSEEGTHLRQMIVLALTDDDRLHTQEVQRLWALVKDDITLDRVIGVAWGALTQYSLAQAEQLVPAVGGLRQVLQV